ncbi:MAG TPA: HAD hydrolase-like protein [Syntrophobacter fumaroxidans]|nr:HAD hydrolase-like protein [Syntrophobacter fumaroxidans]
MEPARIKVCIFDVNGVLIDSNAANAQAMAQAFTEDPELQSRIVDAYLQLTGIDRGSKMRIVQDRVVGRPFTENEFELRWEGFKRLGRISMLRAPLTTGCREVLAELGRMKITRVALSNTPLEELREALANRGLNILLDEIRGGGDWPKSETLARFLRDCRIEPRHCLFLGDGKGDLDAARRNGVPFAAIDPGTGEFRGETGFDGPYPNIAEWLRSVLNRLPQNKLA